MDKEEKETCTECGRKFSRRESVNDKSLAAIGCTPDEIRRWKNWENPQDTQEFITRSYIQPYTMELMTDDVGKKSIRFLCQNCWGKGSNPKQSIVIHNTGTKRA